MKRVWILLAVCLWSVRLSAQSLRFDKNGTFKIVQFTDVHFQPNHPASEAALQVMNETLEAERPDLVILTGDVVTKDPSEGWEKVLAPIVSRKIPFAVTLGNHDDECGLSRGEVADLVVSMPGNLNTKQVKGVKGYLNDVLTVAGSKTGKPAFALYCMDSNNYSTIEAIEGYGWFTPDQIDWYVDRSNRMTKRNKGVPLPSLAFFHIALPEYKTAFDQVKRWKRTGDRLENECAPKLNTGLFARMLEQQDIVGVFVGHDHDNDYVVNYAGIALGFGRFTGGRTTYTHRMNGARVIELKEGRRGFESWVRLRDGRVTDRACFPEDYR